MTDTNISSKSLLKNIPDDLFLGNEPTKNELNDYTEEYNTDISIIKLAQKGTKISIIQTAKKVTELYLNINSDDIDRVKHNDVVMKFDKINIHTNFVDGYKNSVLVLPVEYPLLFDRRYYELHVGIKTNLYLIPHTRLIKSEGIIQVPEERDYFGNIIRNSKEIFVNIYRVVGWPSYELLSHYVNYYDKYGKWCSSKSPQIQPVSLLDFIRAVVGEEVKCGPKPEGFDESVYIANYPQHHNNKSLVKVNE